MSTDTLCPTVISPVTATDYVPQGLFVTTYAYADSFRPGSGGTTLYVSCRSAAPTRLFVVAYDIFGYHNNLKQLCDVMAVKKADTVIVMPDFFRGQQPAEGEDKRAWVSGVAPWDTSVRPMLVDTLAYIRTTYPEVKSVVGLGFCWGAKPMFAASAEGLIQCAAVVHPSRLTAEDAASVTGPICVIATKNEPPMDEVKAALDAKPFAAKNVWLRFDDMHHGYAAARGDWSVPEQRARVQETIDIILTFADSSLA